MDDRTQLTNLILILLQNQYLLNTRTAQFTSLAEDVISLVNISSTSNLSNTDTGVVISALVAVIQEMLKDGIDKKVEPDALMTHLRTVCTHHPKIVDQLEKNITRIPERNESELDSSINYLLSHLEKWVNTNKYKRILTHASFNFDPELDREEQWIELQEKISPYLKDHNNIRSPIDIPGVEQCALINDPVQFKDAFSYSGGADEDGNTKLRFLKTDMAGWNTSLGGDGFRIPSVTLINALTGKGKTTTAQKLLRGISKMNDGNDFVKPGRKALHLYISAENPMEEIIKELYHDYCGEEEGYNKELSDWQLCHEYLKSTMLLRNWHLVVLFVRKGKLAVESVEDIIRYYEDDGFQLVTCLIDYLHLLDYSHCPGGNDTAKITSAAGVLEGAVKTARNAALFNLAQLSPHLKEYAAVDNDFAKKYGPQMATMWCKGLGNEYDYAITVNIQPGSRDGKYYHQWNVDKNRLDKTTSVAHLYAVHRMHTLDNGTQGGFIKGDCDPVTGESDPTVRDTTGGQLRSSGGAGFEF